MRCVLRTPSLRLCGFSSARFSSVSELSIRARKALLHALQSDLNSDSANIYSLCIELIKSSDEDVPSVPVTFYSTLIASCINQASAISEKLNESSARFLQTRGMQSQIDEALNLAIRMFETLKPSFRTSSVINHLLFAAALPHQRAITLSHACRLLAIQLDHFSYPSSPLFPNDDSFVYFAATIRRFRLSSLFADLESHLSQLRVPDRPDQLNPVSVAGIYRILIDATFSCTASGYLHRALSLQSLSRFLGALRNLRVRPEDDLYQRIIAACEQFSIQFPLRSFMVTETSAQVRKWLSEDYPTVESTKSRPQLTPSPSQSRSDSNTRSLAQSLDDI